MGGGGEREREREKRRGARKRTVGEGEKRRKRGSHRRGQFEREGAKEEREGCKEERLGVKDERGGAKEEDTGGTLQEKKRAMKKKESNGVRGTERVVGCVRTLRAPRMMREQINGATSQRKKARALSRNRLTPSHACAPESLNSFSLARGTAERPAWHKMQARSCAAGPVAAGY